MALSASSLPALPALSAQLIEAASGERYCVATKLSDDGVVGAERHTHQDSRNPEKVLCKIQQQEQLKPTTQKCVPSSVVKESELYHLYGSPWKGSSHFADEQTELAWVSARLCTCLGS